MPPDVRFHFLDPGPLCDGDLTLKLTRRADADAALGRLPSYWFTLRAREVSVGMINLRVGHTPELERFDGHLGYTVYPPYRGHHYACRACRLLLPLAAAHGLDPVWITCDPDNVASRRTCEALGAVFVDFVHRRPTIGLTVEGEARKCRYRLDVKAMKL